MRYLKGLGGLTLMALLLARPGAASRGAAEAMAHWRGTVAPALFPFLALLPLLTCDESARAYERLLGRAMGRLFGLPGGAAPAVIAGLVAGAPAGAIVARNVAARSGMNRGQLQRVAAASAGFSPAFLVAGVGAGMLGSAPLGWRLLMAQMMTQLTLMFMLRRAWRERTEPVPEVTERAQARPVCAAVLSVLTIGGYMALFGALSGAIEALLGRGPADALLCVMDVPSAARRVAGMGMGEGATLTLLAAMCGFGGLCVVAQSLGALAGCGVNAAEYVATRAVAAALNGLYMRLLTRLSAGGGWTLARLAANPFAIASLAAALLCFPILAALNKSIS